MELRRNDSTKPLIVNGYTRPGQFDWHTAECMMEDHGITGNPPVRSLWCATHGQWACEVPISVTYKFDNCDEFVRLRPLQK